MKKIIWIMVSLCFSLPSTLLAQEPEKPQTKLERFTAETGVVIVRGYEKIGSLKGLYQTSVTVDAKEFYNPITNKKEYGIGLDVKDGSGRIEKSNESYIDYDEINSLVSGIDYIAKIDQSVTSLSGFQADFSTKGDLRITTFSADGGIKIAVSSGKIRSATAYYEASELNELRELIIAAKAKVDSLKK